MINAEELTLCKRRGHDTGFVLKGGWGWSRCKWCGIWLRTVEITEEREDEPPENEKHPLLKIDKRLARLDPGSEGSDK